MKISCKVYRYILTTCAFLKNIYNEFVIYYNRLNITELDCNKMLAIIAYKKICSRAIFADLQLNQGFVYAIFLPVKIHLLQKK